MRNKFLLLFASLLFMCSAHAEVWQGRYGVGETFNFKLYNTDGTLDVDEADGGTEVSVSCNEGAETTSTNDFVDEGTFYSITLSNAEMQCERIAVVIAATTTEVFFIQTINHASAMNPMTWADVQNYGGSAGTFSSGRPEVNTTHAAGTAWGSGAITAAAIATDAIGAAEIADAAIDEATFACSGGSFKALGIVDCGTAQAYTAGTPSLTLRSAVAFGDNTLTGATLLICGSTQGYCQAGLAASNVGSTDVVTLSAALPVAASGTVTYYVFGTAASSGSISIAAGGITASSFAAGAIDAAAIAADAIGASEIAADAIGASELATDAIGAAEVAADAVGASELATDAIGAAELAASAIGASEIADGGITSTEFGTGAITATVLAADAIGSSELADGAIDAATLATDTITAAKVAADAIGASEVATDAIGAAEVAADAGAELGAANWAITLSEPSGKPSWGGAVSTWMSWLGAWSRNEINQTSTTKTLRNDADSGNLVTCAVSDDGTTFSLQECAP